MFRIKPFINVKHFGFNLKFFHGTERKRSGDGDVIYERSNEEHWNLRDVIFVEDVRNVPVGKVLKVTCFLLLLLIDKTQGRCEKGARNMRESCVKVAWKVRERCEKGARKVQKSGKARSPMYRCIADTECNI